jgi:hypothetical protein
MEKAHFWWAYFFILVEYVGFLALLINSGTLTFP